VSVSFLLPQTLFKDISNITNMLSIKFTWDLSVKFLSIESLYWISMTALLRHLPQEAFQWERYRIIDKHVK
jgi:hypothetical protein